MNAPTPMIDWRFAVTFAWGEALAGIHYAGYREGITRGVGIFMIYVALAVVWKAARSLWRVVSSASVRPTEDTRP